MFKVPFWEVWSGVEDPIHPIRNRCYPPPFMALALRVTCGRIPYNRRFRRSALGRTRDLILHLFSPFPFSFIHNRHLARIATPLRRAVTKKVSRSLKHRSLRLLLKLPASTSSRFYGRSLLMFRVSALGSWQTAIIGPSLTFVRELRAYITRHFYWALLRCRSRKSRSAPTTIVSLS